MSIMPETLFVEERRRAILDELRRNGRVSVKQLSDALAVSTVTIRQDLRSLEDGGYLERTYGGAVSRVTDSLLLPELSFHVRQNRQRQAKDAIARASVALIHDGDTIGLDASTTAFALVAYLKVFAKLTVLTNSLIIAQSFLDSPHVQVLLPSGRLRRDSISIVGRPEGLPDVNLNLAFLGARGITWAEGVSDVDPDEVTMKQAMIARSVTTVIVADGSKWGQVAPYTLVRSSQLQRIVTSDAPQALVDDFRAQGVHVDVATHPSNDSHF